jgi:hypothetical protein
MHRQSHIGRYVDPDLIVVEGDLQDDPIAPQRVCLVVLAGEPVS